MRPRILLVPSLTELEWRIRPLLEEWAEVASYDGPGVGAEAAAEGLRVPATAERGLVELDRRGWDRCVVVGDEFGAGTAALLAGARPEAVQGLVLGHAVVSFRRSGDRPALNPGVTAALAQLADVDFRSFIRQEARTWHGLRPTTGEAAGPDELADEYLQRVSHTSALAFWRELIAHEQELHALVAERLRRLDAPLLLVRHVDCLMFTPEGYEDAVAAFPHARTATTVAKPTVDPAFAGILRGFCDEVAREPAPAGG